MWSPCDLGTGSGKRQKDLDLTMKQLRDKADSQCHPGPSSALKCLQKDTVWGFGGSASEANELQVPPSEMMSCLEKVDLIEAPVAELLHFCL